MKNLSLAILAPAVLLLSSCVHRGDAQNQYISYVDTVLNDTSAVGYHVLREHDTDDKYKSISVAGDPVDVLPIIQEMMVGDYFNNIDGRGVPDGLPDLSGEMVEGLLDETNAPYEGYLKRDNPDFLREIQVRNFISALDTNYLYSPYDMNQLEERSGAKIVVLGSPEAYLYGKHDVDTLCHMLGKEIPVFTAMECVFDQVFSKKQQERYLCVWTTTDKVENRIYSQSYAKYKSEHGIQAGRDLLIYNPDIYMPIERRFRDILDMYLQSHHEEPLSVMVVDDPNIDMKALEECAADLMQSTDESELAYRNILADEFEIIYPAKAVSKKIYKHLRACNGFTHKISRPLFKGYITLPVNDLPVVSYDDDGDYTDDFKFLRPEGGRDETWLVIAMRNRYISDELRSMIGILAPKILD